MHASKYVTYKVTHALKYAAYKVMNSIVFLNLKY